MTNKSNFKKGNIVRFADANMSQYFCLVLDSFLISSKPFIRVLFLADFEICDYSEKLLQEYNLTKIA